jgi:hypothetical protein
MTETTIAAVGDVAPDKTLLDDCGTPTALSDLWSERPLVLMLVRHLG